MSEKTHVGNAHVAVGSAQCHMARRDACAAKGHLSAWAAHENVRLVVCHRDGGSNSDSTDSVPIGACPVIATVGCIAYNGSRRAHR